eukprot:m.33433 g.33433  ORF g.33433 m.33433 type:complete len:84 (+) comp7189_c0_seq1:191-442(+)
MTRIRICGKDLMGNMFGGAAGDGSVKALESYAAPGALTPADIVHLKVRPPHPRPTFCHRVNLNPPLSSKPNLFSGLRCGGGSG